MKFRLIIDFGFKKRCMIEDGRHGETKDDQGNIHFFRYSKSVTILYRAVKWLQLGLEKCHVSVHDPIFGECVRDFSCCVDSISENKFHISIQ